MTPWSTPQNKLILWKFHEHTEKDGRPEGKWRVSRAGWRLRSTTDRGSRMCMDFMMRGRALEMARLSACWTWLRFQGPAGRLSRGESGDGGRWTEGWRSDSVRSVTAASSWLKSCPKPDSALAPGVPFAQWDKHNTSAIGRGTKVLRREQDDATCLWVFVVLAACCCCAQPTSCTSINGTIEVSYDTLTCNGTGTHHCTSKYGKS